MEKIRQTNRKRQSIEGIRQRETKLNKYVWVCLDRERTRKRETEKDRKKKHNFFIEA